MNYSSQQGTPGRPIQNQNQDSNQMSQDMINFQADLGIALAQVEDYKSKYFQALKDIDRQKQEIESLRAMLQQTQSLRGTDPRQADDLRRNFNQLQQENQQLKLDISNQNQSQQQQQQFQVQQPMAQIETQQKILQLQNELNVMNLQMQGQEQMMKQKQSDYEQLRVRVQARDFINSIPPGQEQNRLLVLQRENQRLNEIINQRDMVLESLRVQVNEQRMVSQEKDNLSGQLRDYEEKIVSLSRDLENLLTSVGGLRHDVLLRSEFDKVKQQLNTSERESKEWRDKYQRLENDSQHLVEMEKQRSELETRVTKLQEEIDKIELENRGMQLRQQAFDRLLKEKENMQQKIQEMDSNISDLEKQLSEKRRETENLKRLNKEKDEDFINFKENIYKPLEDRAKRLEVDIENWRNKCLALENNFFGNNERYYVENEFRRLHAVVLAQQQENEEIKIKLRTIRQSNVQPQQDNSNEERTKLLYAERERLFSEMEQLRKKNQSLEQEIGGIRQQGGASFAQPFAQPFAQTQHHIQIIQEGGGQPQNDEVIREKDRQLEELKQGIEQLIDENKILKEELDSLQIQIEQLEIDKSYLMQRQQVQQVPPRDREMNNLDGNDVKRLKDMLEQRSYEAQEWKDKFQLQQGQARNKENQQNPNPRAYSNALLEQEYRKLRQMHEMKTLEAEEYKQRLLSNKQDVTFKNADNDLPKYKMLLEMRTAECEEWRQKCLRNNRSSVNDIGPKDDRLKDDQIRYHQQMHETKSKEYEELRNRYTEVLKGGKDKGTSSQIDDLQNELRKHQRLHELKSMELQEIQPKVQRSQEVQRERDIMEHELRRMKQVLEQQIIENEQLKRKLNGGQQNLGVSMQNKTQFEQQLREYQMTIQQLQAEVQRAGGQIKDRNIEYDKIKQSHILQQDQIKSVAFGQNNSDQRLRDLNDEHEKVKSILKEKLKETEELKTHHKQFQKIIQSQQQENNELKKGGQSTEQLKAQIMILQNKLQDLGGQNKQLQDQIAKMGNAVKDQMIENEKLKQSLQKVEQYKREKDAIVGQLQQIRVTLEAKQKENDQLRQALAKAQQGKNSEHQQLALHSQQHQEKLANLVQEFKGGLKK